MRSALLPADVPTSNAIRLVVNEICSKHIHLSLSCVLSLCWWDVRNPDIYMVMSDLLTVWVQLMQCTLLLYVRQIVPLISLFVDRKQHKKDFWQAFDNKCSQTCAAINDTLIYRNVKKGIFENRLSSYYEGATIGSVRGQSFQRALSISFLLMEQGLAIKWLWSGGQESWNYGELLCCTLPWFFTFHYAIDIPSLEVRCDKQLYPVSPSLLFILW